MARIRLLAVLFTDIVGSTAWRSTVGDAEADEVMAALDARLRASVERCEGEVIKHLGDGLMAIFTSASDAVAGAVAIQQVIARDRRRLGSAELEVRVGISAGDVNADGADVQGLPVVEAARLCDAAGPGRILCRDLIQALAGSRSGVDFSPVGELDLKGLAEPLAAFEVHWEPAASVTVPLPPALAGAHQFGFVGRQRERDLLREAWRAVEAGGRRGVLVSGEPGVGKTRLVAEMAGEVAAAGGLVLFGRSDESLGIPYQPFAEALRHYVTNTAEPELGRFGADLARLMPELSGHVRGLGEPLRSDPESEQYRLFESVARWLAAASTADPLLLVLDDLQWATRPTLLLLRHVLSADLDQRLLVAATYRDTDVDRAHPLAALLGDLYRVDGFDRVELEGLDQAGVQDFISTAAGHDMGEAGTTLAAELHDSTGGNAFFLSEVIRNLSEAGAIFERDGRWYTDQSLTDLGGLPGVREVIRRRLGRLTPAANEVLEVSAAIGAEFDLPVLARAGDFDTGTLDHALGAAVEAQLLHEVGGPILRHRFAHALVRSTVYDDLSAVRRVALHRRIGEVLADRVGEGGGGAGAADLAHHYLLAAADGDATDAIRWSTRAGDEARARSAFDEAVVHYERALELQAAGGGSDADRCDLLLGLGSAQWAIGDDGYRVTLLDAARLAGRLGDGRRQVEALIASDRGMPDMIGLADPERTAVIESGLAVVGDEDSVERARLLSELALSLIYVPGSYDRRCALTGEAVAMARRLADPDTLADTLQHSWVTIWAPGTRAARHAAYEELDRLDVGRDDPVRLALAGPRRIMRAVESLDIAGAWRASRALDAAADELGLPVVRWLAGVNRAALLEIAGDLDGAEEAGDAAYRVGLAAGQPEAELFRQGLAVSLAAWRDELAPLEELLAGLHQALPDLPGLLPALALTVARQGRFDEAHEVAAELFAAPGGIARDGTTLTGWTILSDICGLDGWAEPAPALLDVLGPISGTIVGNGINWNQTTDLRIGILSTVVGDWAAAQAAFDRAGEISRRMEAPLWAANIAMENAAMCAARAGPGDVARAASLLDVAVTAAEPRGAGYILTRSARIRSSLV